MFYYKRLPTHHGTVYAILNDETKPGDYTRQARYITTVIGSRQAQYVTAKLNRCLYYNLALPIPEPIKLATLITLEMISDASKHNQDNQDKGRQK